MICKQCGSIFDATKHKFCLSCGASIFLIPPKPPQLPLTSLPTSKSPKKSHGKRFGALGGVFGIVLILVAVGSVPDFVPESN